MIAEKPMTRVSLVRNPRDLRKNLGNHTRDRLRETERSGRKQATSATRADAARSRPRVSRNRNRKGGREDRKKERDRRRAEQLRSWGTLERTLVARESRHDTDDESAGRADLMPPGLPSPPARRRAAAPTFRAGWSTGSAARSSGSRRGAVASPSHADKG